MPYCTGLRPDEQESVCYRYLMQDADGVDANMVAVRSHLTKPSTSVATQPQSHPSNMTEYICEHVSYGAASSRRAGNPHFRVASLIRHLGYGRPTSQTCSPAVPGELALAASLERHARCGVLLASRTAASARVPVPGPLAPRPRELARRAVVEHIECVVMLLELLEALLAVVVADVVDLPRTRATISNARRHATASVGDVRRWPSLGVRGASR